MMVSTASMDLNASRVFMKNTHRSTLLEIPIGSDSKSSPLPEAFTIEDTFDLAKFLTDAFYAIKTAQIYMHCFSASAIDASRSGIDELHVRPPM